MYEQRHQSFADSFSPSSLQHESPYNTNQIIENDYPDKACVQGPNWNLRSSQGYCPPYCNGTDEPQEFGRSNCHNIFPNTKSINVPLQGPRNGLEMDQIPCDFNSQLELPTYQQRLRGIKSDPGFQHCPNLESDVFITSSYPNYVKDDLNLGHLQIQDLPLPLSFGPPMAIALDNFPLLGTHTEGAAVDPALLDRNGAQLFPFETLASTEADSSLNFQDPSISPAQSFCAMTSLSSQSSLTNNLSNNSHQYGIDESSFNTDISKISKPFESYENASFLFSFPCSSANDGSNVLATESDSSHFASFFPSQEDTLPLSSISYPNLCSSEESKGFVVGYDMPFKFDAATAEADGATRVPQNELTPVSEESIVPLTNEDLIASFEGTITTENGKRKIPITRVPCARAKLPKKYCNLCNERKEGFRGDHELKRHMDRVHAPVRKVWVCFDNSFDRKTLATCKKCRNGKKYGTNYNAAAHLRRAHFCDKRRRGVRGEPLKKPEGPTPLNWPSMEQLKPWLREVDDVVGPISWQPLETDEDDTYDDEDDYDDDDDSQLTLTNNLASQSASPESDDDRSNSVDENFECDDDIRDDMNRKYAQRPAINALPSYAQREASKQSQQAASVSKQIRHNPKGDRNVAPSAKTCAYCWAPSHPGRPCHNPQFKPEYFL